jgi:hypothetical protein
MSEDRLTQKDIALAKARMKYIAANKNKKKTQDRLTQEDVDLAESRMPYLEANQDKTQDRLTQTDIARAKARMPYLAANKRHGGAINSRSKDGGSLSEERDAYVRAKNSKGEDRVTSKDIEFEKRNPSKYKTVKGVMDKDGQLYYRDNKRIGGAINSQSKAQQDRLELERKMALERARRQYSVANRSQTQDRLTQDDVARAKARMKYMSEDNLGSTLGIYPFVRKNKSSKSEMEKDKKTFQNDRTKPLPKEAYTQDDQALRYDADTSTEGSFSHGGEVRGGGAAIRGKGFKGVF